MFSAELSFSEAISMKFVRIEGKRIKVSNSGLTLFNETTRLLVCAEVILALYYS